MSHSLVLRVIIPVAVVLVLVISGLIAAMTWLSMQDARTNLGERAKLTALGLANGLAPLAWSVDWDGVQRELVSLRADPDYAGSIVWDESNKVVGQDGSADLGGRDIVGETSDINYIDDNGVAHLVGRVAVSLKTDRAEARMIPRLSGIAVGGFLALLITCGVLVYIVRGFIQPINALTSVMTGLAEGDVDIPIPAIDRPDEIGRMASATEVFKRNTLALIAGEARYRELLENLMEGVFQTTPEGRLLSANSAMVDILGWHSAEEMVATITDIAGQIYVHRSRRAELLRLVREKGGVRGFEASLRRKDGSRIEVLLSCRGVVAGGDFVGLEGTMVDITERKRVEQQLSIAATAFDSQEGMMVTDEHSVILRVNRAFLKASGYKASEVVGQTPRLFKSGRQNADFYRAMWKTIKRAGIWQGEMWNRRKNGEEYLVWLTISAVKGTDGVVTHYVGTQFDITERKEAEEKIQHLAFFDQLTGLPNRTLLLDRMRQAMTASERNANHGALLFIDLDNFKTLNDTLGHDMGDLLLKRVAELLRDCVRAGDTVARFGGDEFLLMLEGLSSNATDAAAHVDVVGEKIVAALNKPVLLNNTPFHCTPSIGVTLFKGQTASVEDLLKQADLAMYKSKAAGRNTIRFFDPGMEAAVMKRASLEADLRDAVEQKLLQVHFQPQVVGDGRVTGGEVLARWPHPIRGMVSPAEFIPLAEETGLILPLGLWVLETACSQLALWAEDPATAHLTLAVNVSARQFLQTDFVDQVSTILKNANANPKQLKLELTESLLVDNMQDVVEKMFALKASGVGFSLDDFGTGYSSLAYLKRLPLDQLKIDQSFVRDVLVDSNDAVIAKTVVALAQSFGLGVIAEGVETEAQRDFLASVGCQAYQGYFFSRPLPLADFERFVRDAGVPSAARLIVSS
jgi:diguanylate cyclase (GGDEF)-like protein/PAS domain S-box-containing protein